MSTHKKCNYKYGKSTKNFNVEGEYIIVENPMDYIGKCDGKIVIINNAPPDVIFLLNEALAVVSETGGITSHLAILGIEMDANIVIGVVNIIEYLKDKKTIKIVSNSGRAIIYAK